jgi:hypothetical protein
MRISPSFGVALSDGLSSVLETGFSTGLSKTMPLINKPKSQALQYSSDVLGGAA